MAKEKQLLEKLTAPRPPEDELATLQALQRLLPSAPDQAWARLLDTCRQKSFATRLRALKEDDPLLEALIPLSSALTHALIQLQKELQESYYYSATHTAALIDLLLTILNRHWEAAKSPST